MTYCSKAPRAWLAGRAGAGPNDLRNFAPSEQHTEEVQHVYERAAVATRYAHEPFDP